jgi:hypothetical protein
MLVESINKMLLNKGDYKDDPELQAELGEAFAKAFFKHISEVKKDDEENKTQILAPSRATKCVRQSFFKRVGMIAQPPEPRRLLTFLWGDLTEASFRYLARRSGVKLVGNNQKLLMRIGSEKDMMYGYVDDIGQGRNSGKKFIVEFKSMTGFSWKKFKEAGEKDEPVPDEFGYGGQVHTYARGALEAGIIDKPGWVLIFAFNKDTGHIYERFVKYDPKIAAIADRNWDTIKKAVADGKEPPRPTDMQPFKKARARKDSLPELPIQCQYCDWKFSCWEERIPERFQLNENGHFVPCFKEGDLGNGDRIELNFAKDRFGGSKPVWNYKKAEV